MKKTVKRIFITITSVMLVLTIAWFFKANAELVTTDQLVVNGAGVRTDEKTGIKFEAQSTYDATNVQAYGIVVMLGEHQVDNVYVGAEGAFEALVSKTDDAGYFYLTIFGFPEVAYVNKITARAFVVLNDDSYVYADTVAVRSLAEVAIGAKELQVEGDFIDKVVNYVASNYKSTWTDESGNVFMTNTIYESNYAKLANEFVSDWNEMFATEFTAPEAFYNGSSSEWYKSAKTSSQTDWTSSKLKEFFQNETMYAKWGWIFDYITTELTNGTGYGFVEAQINAIVNNTEDTANWYYGAHLSSFIMSIMTGSKQSSGWGSYDFGNNYNKLGLITNYNNTVYADISNVEIVKTGNTITLPDALTPATGYEWDGWYLGDTKYAANEIVVVGADVNSVFMPKFNAINYNITYYNDEIELTDKASTYTIENSVTLPILEVEGYDFEGWYEDAGFTGNVVTEIAVGSTGDKVYYAKLTEKLFEEVNVTFDPNGGVMLYETLEEAIADFLIDYNTARSKSHTVETFYALGSMGEISDASLFLYNAVYKAKWTWLVNYIATVASSTNKAAFTNFYNYSSQSELNAANSNYIYSVAYELRGWVAQAQYTKNSNFKTADYSSTSIKTSALKAAQGETEFVYKDPCTLPVPVMGDLEFIGWKSSIDGSIVTEYPGYNTNPGDITYTAQWNVEEYDITYVLNGGYIRYATKDEMIADLIADFKAATGASYTSASDFPTGNYSITTVDDFYYATVNGVSMTTKWKWLMTFLYDNAVGSANKTAFSKLLAGDEITGESYPYALSYEFRAFLQSTTYRSGNTTYGSADYSNEALANGFWSYLVGAETTYVSTGNFGSTTLPIIYHPDGVEFGGWYTSSDLSGTAITSVSSATTLYAKWKSYNVSYELDGGFFTSYDGLTSNSYRTAVTSDLLNDINTFTGRSFGLETFFSNTYNASVNYMDNFFADSTYGTKWAWLLTYINAVRATRSKAALVSGSAAAEYRGEIHNFLNGIAPGTATSNFGSDYSQDLHGYRLYLSNSIAEKYSEVLSQTAISELPVPIKIGGTFNGWYSDAEMTQQVTKITSDCTLYASFLMDGSGYFDITFETNSYVTVGESITINVAFTSYNGDDVTIAWKTSDANIANVIDGVVTGVAEGTAAITVYVIGEETTTYESINIVVVSASQSEALSLVLNSHESNIFIKENLPIGSGTPAYYANIYGSVNKLLFNSALVIDETYNTGDPDNSGSLTATEFITVHYTGNMAAGADAEANASYFAQDNSVSIHYTTGNDGVFHCLDDSLWAWHAGASGGSGWNKTNVAYSSSDPKWPTFGINSSSHFTLNGKDTGITVPNETTKGYGYVTASKWLNSQGLGWKIVNGYYYICNTEWQYKQVAEGRICNAGGNDTSIGIESCVNKGSDLWYTWQKTAQLVAKLMDDNNLGIERVVGHHFFDGKDCPQPLLENDMEIWWEFIELVEAEYALRNLSGYTITMTESNNYIDSNGRIIERPKLTEVIEYTVSIYNSSTGKTETVTLSSVIKGYAVEE